MKSQFKNFIDESEIPENKSKENKEISIENKSERDNSNNISKEEKQMVDHIIDDMGFSRYNLLICTTAALILFCGGIQELMQAILLSLIGQVQTLTDNHLALANTSEYCGNIISAILLNVILSYISPKIAIRVFGVFTLIFTALSISSYNYYLAISSRLFIGICLGIIDLLIYIYVVENCPTKIRGFVCSAILIFFPFGELGIGIFGYFVISYKTSQDDYKYLLLAPFIVSVIVVLLTFFIQDLPRHMIANNEIGEGLKIIRKISKFNNQVQHIKETNEDLNSVPLNNNNESIKVVNSTVKNSPYKIDKLGESIKSFFSKKGYLTTKQQFQKIFSKGYKKITPKIWVLGFLTGFMFNGIFFMLPTTAPKINKDEFANVIFTLFWDLPAYFFASLIVEFRFLGRIRSMNLGYILTFCVSLSTVLIGSSYLTICCLFRASTIVARNVMIVYTFEIYETNVRTFGISFMNCFRRLGAIIAPYLLNIAKNNYGDIGIFYVFLPLSMIAFLISCTIDIETMGVPLDEIEPISA